MKRRLSAAIGAAAAELCCVTVLASPMCLSPGQEAAAFEAAGYVRKDGQWRSCDDPGTASYVAGAIREVRDLNGDGYPEAVIAEGGTYCYGITGWGFSVVSQAAGGDWTLVVGGTGIPRFLTEKGTNGWPDIEVGGPGFCFPVMRREGQSYHVDRYQYEGQACRN